MAKARGPGLMYRLKPPLIGPANQHWSNLMTPEAYQLGHKNSTGGQCDDNTIHYALLGQVSLKIKTCK